MQNLTNPRWLFLVHTLPLMLLIALCYAEFAVIKTLLPPASLLLWQQLSSIVAGLLLATAGYAATQLRRGRRVGVGYAVLALAAHIGLLAVGVSYVSEIMPRDIPRWMIGMDVVLLAFTFLMPVLTHALFVLVARFTPADRPHHSLPNFLLALVVPAGWYTTFFVLEEIWAGPAPRFVENVTLVVFILSTLSFLFFLVRGVYSIGLRRSADAPELHVAWKVVVALVFPLLGLAVNNGLLFEPFGSFGHAGSGIFGNFNSFWFYGLAVLNGVLLCLPGGTQPRWRLLLLAGRSVMLAYTFYFFLVFLPFLPLSVVAVIAVGVGFLMLTPLALLLVHVQELSTDYGFLRQFFTRWQLRAAIVAGALVLPLGITATYWHQRQVLHGALAYLYSPNYADSKHLNKQALASTLAVVRQHKERNQDFMFSSRLPYLSMYFNWLVLDNLTLSEDKLSMMEQVFLGPSDYERQNPGWRNPTFASRQTAATPRAVLRHLTTRSTFDKRQQAWESWVNLEVANPAGTGSRATEYATELELPTGCWINGYYLDIGNRREAGVLAEKKAAHWVFSQIVNVSQDPGILHYLTGNRVALRVFPVTGAEARTTGIRFLHKEPVVVTLDGRSIQLGDTTGSPLNAPVATPDESVTYVPAAAKNRLPLVQRQPYYHFLLDVSKNQGPQKTAYTQQVQGLLAAHPLPGKPRFSLVSTYATPVPAAEWQTSLTQAPNAGGLYLEGAIRRILTEEWQHPTATYPVVVVVTNQFEQAILTQDFADLSAAYPEAPWFYHQALDGVLIAHDLRRNSQQPLSEPHVPGMEVLVRAWPNANAPLAYLPANQEAAIVLNTTAGKVNEGTQLTGSWQTALRLHGYSQWQTQHPETTDAERVPAIKASFRAGIMTPFTSYLALENEAQKAALRRKQTQTLAGNAALDAGEEAPPTSVPIDGGAALLLAAGAALGLKHLRQQKSQHRSAGVGGQLD